MNRENRAFKASLRTILEITLETLRHDSELKLCEGLRLIEATRKSVERNTPDHLDDFDRKVLPRLRRALQLRFGLPDEGEAQ